jgi:formylglycine-generating enzyme required for sulfatase activity
MQSWCRQVAMSLLCAGAAAGGPLADHLVVDVSGGAMAKSYPVSDLAAVPERGWTDEYKTTKIVLRRIPAGTFMMGSPTNELGRQTGEVEMLHEVTLTKGFFIGVFEVTQRQLG